MAKVLIGWELGGNYGHLSSIEKLSVELAKDGHQSFLALQRIDGISRRFVAGEQLLQAPIWPNLLKDVHRELPQVPHATYGDIFDALCLDKPNALTSMLEAWQVLLDLVKPDAVVAETAPALLMAARGRFPTIRIGSGYDVPPSEMARFPSLTGRSAVRCEMIALEKINTALSQTSCHPVRFYPEIFKSDADIVACLEEFDPYAEWREACYCRPAMGSKVPPLAVKRGNEIFVYFHAVTQHVMPVWKALSQTKLPVRIHVPDADEEHTKALADLGFKFESKPVPLDKIMRRSRMIISHGGLGLSSAAAMCGVPHLVLSHDIEKSLNGNAVARMGAGLHAPLFEVDSTLLGQQILTLYHDPDQSKKGVDLARRLQSRKVNAMISHAKDVVYKLID